MANIDHKPAIDENIINIKKIAEEIQRHRGETATMLHQIQVLNNAKPTTHDRGVLTDAQFTALTDKKDGDYYFVIEADGTYTEKLWSGGALHLVHAGKSAPTATGGGVKGTSRIIFKKIGGTWVVDKTRTTWSKYDPSKTAQENSNILKAHLQNHKKLVSIRISLEESNSRIELGQTIDVKGNYVDGYFGQASFEEYFYYNEGSRSTRYHYWDFEIYE